MSQRFAEITSQVGYIAGKKKYTKKKPVRVYKHPEWVVLECRLLCDYRGKSYKQILELVPMLSIEEIRAYCNYITRTKLVPNPKIATYKPA